MVKRKRKNGTAVGRNDDCGPQAMLLGMDEDVLEDFKKEKLKDIVLKKWSWKLKPEAK